MEAVKSHYVKKLHRDGVALTGEQLLSFATQSKLKGVTRQQVYQFLREEAPSAGPFARRDRKVERQTFCAIRPGVYFIDYGEFHKNWSGSNTGATGFLVAVENLTNRLFVLPTRGKDTVQWLNSIRKFVELTRQVAIIYTDRDSVAQSASFRDQIVKEFGIKWYFLKKGHKSFLAERYVGFVKTKLSQALDSRSDGEKIEKRWVDFVDPLTKEYNMQRIPGTTYRRQAVARENFNDFLKQYFGTPDYDLRFTSFAIQPFQTEAWNRALFKFNLGDRVRVSRFADWTDSDNKRGFLRVATSGGFGKKIYTVSGRQLRATSSGSRYIPAYQLKEIPNCGFVFYEQELVKVSGSSSPSAGD